MRNPQAQQSLAQNSRIKIIYDTGGAGGYESVDEVDGELQAAMEASLRPTPPPLAAATPLQGAVELFHRHGILDYSVELPNGFYACFGAFPDAADDDETPTLAALQRCAVMPGRDVVLFDLQSDPALAEFKHQVISRSPPAGGDGVLAHVAWVAQLVAARLGGPLADEKLAERYSEYSAGLQARQRSVVLSASKLKARSCSSLHCQRRLMRAARECLWQCIVCRQCDASSL
jgi:Ethylene-responsive protein kinase Le-CTR1